MKNLEDAWKFSKVQGNIVTMLTNTLDPKVVSTWAAMMDAYYLNPSSPNPFEEPAPSVLFFLSLFLVLNANKVLPSPISRLNWRRKIQHSGGPGRCTCMR